MLRSKPRNRYIFFGTPHFTIENKSEFDIRYEAYIYEGQRIIRRETAGNIKIVGHGIGGNSIIEYDNSDSLRPDFTHIISNDTHYIPLSRSEKIQIKYHIVTLYNDYREEQRTFNVKQEVWFEQPTPKRIREIKQHENQKNEFEQQKEKLEKQKEEFKNKEEHLKEERKRIKQEEKEETIKNYRKHINKEEDRIKKQEDSIKKEEQRINEEKKRIIQYSNEELTRIKNEEQRITQYRMLENERIKKENERIKKENDQIEHDKQDIMRVKEHLQKFENSNLLNINQKKGKIPMILSNSPVNVIVNNEYINNEYINNEYINNEEIQKKYTEIKKLYTDIKTQEQRLYKAIGIMKKNEDFLYN
jgi:hypothetical protein